MKSTSNLLAALAVLLLSLPAATQTHRLPAASELQLGVEAYDNVDYEGAIEHFQKAVELDPSLVEARSYLATALVKLGVFYQSHHRLPEAEHQFKRAVKVDPKSPASCAALARLLIQEGKKDEAESFLRQTRKELSDNPEGYRMLGDYYATYDVDKAIAEYTSLYSDHPEDLQVKKNYIQLLIMKNRIDEATKLNDDIMKANPQDVRSLVYRGQVEIRRGEANGAVDSLQTAVRNEPENAVAHYELGCAFLQHHDDSQAEREWREALHLRPDLSAVQRALDSLALRRRDSTHLLVPLADSSRSETSGNSADRVQIPSGVSSGWLILKVAPVYPDDARLLPRCPKVCIGAKQNVPCLLRVMGR